MPLPIKIILIVVAVLVVVTICFYIFSYTIFKNSFCRRRQDGDVYNNLDNQACGPWGPHIPYIKEKIKEYLDLKLEDIYIKSNDGLKLHANFYPADKPTNKVVISVHGYMGYRFQDAAIINPFLHEEGYNVLYIDLRGHGESEGNYVTFGVMDHLDLIQWINYIDNRFNHDCSIILHGVSMGGNTVLRTCNKQLPPTVKCIIDDCGFTSAWEEICHVCRTNLHLPSFPAVNMLGQIVKSKAKFSIKDESTEKCVNETKLPICFIHGEQDNFVPTIMSKKNYEACQSEKELHLFPNASHALSYLLNEEEYRKIVMAFIHKYE